jgi:hypothetical protein
MARPDISSLRRGRRSFQTNAASTGMMISVPTHNPASRAIISGG